MSCSLWPPSTWWWPWPTGTAPPSPPTSPPSTTTPPPCGWRSSPPGWRQPSTYGLWLLLQSWLTETLAINLHSLSKWQTQSCDCDWVPSYSPKLITYVHFHMCTQKIIQITAHYLLDVYEWVWTKILIRNKIKNWIPAVYSNFDSSRSKSVFSVFSYVYMSKCL